MPRVLILKRYDRNLRTPFYNALRSKLENIGIQLELSYGLPDKFEQLNIKDYIKPNIGGRNYIQNKYYYFGSRVMCYQPYLKKCLEYDVIIVQQGNKELINYILICLKKIGWRNKIGYWGHGRNFQKKHWLLDFIKKKATNNADHFFAYTTKSAAALIKNGFNPNNISIVNNTIDTREACASFESLTGEDKSNLRSSLGIKAGFPVGIFCGSLYKEKGLEFLIDSILLIKREIPEFSFIVMGDGKERAYIENFCKQNSWCHYVGSQIGYKKALHFSISDVLLIPSYVGLNIIDSFCYSTPLITTDSLGHGPEIDYLKNGINGIITKNTIDEYSSSIIELFKKRHLLNDYKLNCRNSIQFYSLENMVDSFVDGILTMIKKK